MSRRVAGWTRDFLKTEAAGGIVLILAAAGAMLLANIPATAGVYAAMLHTTTGPVLNGHAMTPLAWINDGLMTVFFLVVGLEIRREFVGGRLATAQARLLPVIAAVAGMAVPAIVYLAITAGMPGLARGWAIPAATDIAFAVGVLALLGDRVPPALKLFLLTVAIVDDVGAVAIIALAYTDHIDPLASVGAVGVAAAIRSFGARATVFVALFASLWLLTLLSSVHATIAGVAAALLVPRTLVARLEHALHPWVAFAVVPLFGFANAGVTIGGIDLADPLVPGIALGLFAGKQAGIFGSVWIAERLGIARRPGGARWRQVYGIALLAGIGFTMSLFIGGLALPPAQADTVKIGVLAGSLLSAVTGFVVLWFAATPQRCDVSSTPPS